MFLEHKPETRNEARGQKDKTSRLETTQQQETSLQGKG